MIKSDSEWNDVATMFDDMDEMISESNNPKRRIMANDIENIVKQLGQLAKKYKASDNDLVSNNGRFAIEDAAEKLIYALDLLNSN